MAEPHWDDFEDVEQASVAPAPPASYAGPGTLQPDVGALEAAYQGAVDSTGMSDEGAGMGAGLYDVMNPEPDDQRSVMDRFKSGFAGGMEDERLDSAQAYDAQPDAYAGGTVAGLGVTAPASLAGGRAVRGAVGATQGAMQGDSLESRALNALIGGAGGALMPTGAGDIPALNRRNVTSVLKLPQGEVEDLIGRYGPEGFDAIGEELRRRGVTNGWGSNADEVLARSDAASRSAGQELNTAIRGIDDTAVIEGFPRELVRQDLLRAIGAEGDRGTVAAARSRFERILNAPENGFGDVMSATDIQRLQRLVADSANEFGAASRGVGNDLSKASRYARESLGQDPDVAAAQRSYAQLNSANEGAVKAAAVTRKPFSASGGVSGVIGQAYNKTIGGAPVQTSINKILETTTQVAQGRYAPMFEAAFRQGPNHVNALFYALMQQDPAFNHAVMTQDGAKGGESMAPSYDDFEDEGSAQ